MPSRGAEVLNLSLFGRFRATDAFGNEITIKSKKARALLAFLALSSGKERSREEVMALLWSERGDEQARSSLRQALSGLRKELGESAAGALKVTAESLALDPGLVAVEPASPGDVLLAGLHISDPAFDEWLRDERLRHEDEPVAAAQPPEPSLPDKPSIAVLPFTNLSADPEQEYFADGITEEIITALARLPGFLVIARNSTFVYKGERVEVARVAAELGVRYVLEGSVRTFGGKVRITAQLIDALPGNHIWADTFNGDLEDVFAVQDEITHKIVNSTGSELTLAESERLKSKPPQDLASWQCVLKGSAHFYQYTQSSVAKSEEMARKAIELDNQNAEAYALLALLLWAQAASGFVRPARRAMAEARDAAQHAIALDERSARAHAAMGITLISQFRYDEAMNESERAVELEPGSAEVLAWSGFVLAYTGAHELAVERLRHAVQLNPKDPRMYTRHQALSAANFALGRYEMSLESASRVARQVPEWHGAYTFVLANLGQLGRTEEAGPVLEQTLIRWPHYTVKYAARRHPYRDTEVQERLIEGLRETGVPD